MFLSRVEINPYRRESMKAFASPEVMHAAVMGSFSSFEDKGGDRVLWRVDRLGHAVYLLVQSQRKPDFSHIIDQFGWPEGDQHWDTLDYEEFLAGITAGQIWRFRLKANPVHSVREGSDCKRGKVMAHVTAEQQLDWLMERAPRCGFQIDCGSDNQPNVQIRQRDFEHFRREKKKVSVSTVTFEGVLKITDAEAFIASLRNGIGRAKAYGCGLLTIAKL